MKAIYANINQYAGNTVKCIQNVEEKFIGDKNIEMLKVIKICFFCLDTVMFSRSCSWQTFSKDLRSMPHTLYIQFSKFVRAPTHWKQVDHNSLKLTNYWTVCSGYNKWNIKAPHYCGFPSQLSANALLDSWHHSDSTTVTISILLNSTLEARQCIVCELYV